MDPLSELIMRGLASLQAQTPMTGTVRGTLPPDPAYGPSRPATGGYMASPMPALPVEPPMKPMAPVSLPPQSAPAPGAAPAGLLSAPPSPGAAPPAGTPQPISPLFGAPQAISPLVGGGALPELPSGGLQAAGQEDRGFLDFLAQPELARGLMEMGAKMLAASAPSTDPRSGSLGFALGQGVSGLQGGMDAAKEEQRQKRLDAVNEAYKLAIAGGAGQSASAPEVETIYDPASGLEKKVVWNPLTQQWEDLGGTKAPPRGASGGGVGGPGGIKFGNEKALRSEYLKAVKDVGPVYDGWQRVLAGKSLGTGVGDLSIIFGYMKMLDPTSVVREGEVANARNAAGVPEQILAEYNRVVGGGILSDEQRQQFVAAAEAAWQPFSTRLEDAKRVYGTLATEYGMDPSRIIIDPVPAVVAGSGGGAGGGGPSVDPAGYPEGTLYEDASGAYIIRDGEWVEAD